MAQWNEIHIDSSYWILSDLHFINKDTGIVVGILAPPFQNGEGLYLKTNDGGNTWTQGTSAQYKPAVESMFFVDDTLGYSFGVGCSIKKTTDQGNTWINHSPDYGPHDGADFNLVNDNVGLFITTGGQIARSTDTLKTWVFGEGILYEDHLWHNKVSAFHFVNDTIGYVLGNGIYKTTDQGVSWTPTNSDTSYFYNDLIMLTHLHWMVVGNEGVLLETFNAGLSWDSKRISNFHLRDITFVNDSIGFITGGGNCNHPSDTGVVLTTLNGGISWQEQIISNRGLSAIHCIDSTCYIVGGNQIFKMDNYNVLEITSIAPQVSDLKIWPNPTSDFVELEIIDGSQPWELKIFNAAGKLMHESKRLTNNRVSLINYARGIYFIQISKGPEIHIGKVVKN